jgi:hypothetical protein
MLYYSPAGLVVVAALPGGRHRIVATVPTALVWLAAGSWGTAFMTELRGASNARAKTALSWRPRFPSWVEGFAAEYASRQPAS